MEQFPSVDFTASFHFLFICHLLFFPKVLNVKHHGLRVSASPVLTATGFVNGRWQFSTPTESTPLDRSPKNLVRFWYVWLRRRSLRLCQIWYKSVDGWLPGKWVKYNRIFFNFIYTFFHELTYRSDPLTDFHAWWLKRRGLAHGCAFWGCRWHCCPF